MSKAEVSFADFQAFIAERYGAKDRERGVAKTFLWFMEEVGELASALQKAEDQGEGGDLEGEFADVLGWLTTLANLRGIDLTEALNRRYLSDGGRIHKT